MRANLKLRLLLAGQIGLLTILGWHFRHALNPDAVAYLRIASYFSEGKFALALSGYWGPLLSGLIAAGQLCGLEGLVAARLVMGLSAVFFLWSSQQIFVALQLPERWRLPGLILAALASAWWSVQFITPDLLLAAVLLCAASRMLQEDWLASHKAALQTGAFWGLAYLVKAIALPLGFLAIAVHCGRLIWERKVSWRAALRSSGTSMIAMMVIASPWVLALSAKYGQLTFSTAPPITYTLTGPPDQDRYHPFARTFHQPEPGRITSWEEPSRMEYHHWVPWENWSYARHQIKVLAEHCLTLAVLWTSLNAAALMLAGIWLRQLLRSRGHSPFSDVLWLPVCVAAIYLPCFFTFTEQRFFYVSLPIFFVGTVRWLVPSESVASRGRMWILGLLVAIPLLMQVGLFQDRTATAGRVAAQLADRFRAAQLTGPLAGSANLPGGRTGLYLAFLLQQSWHGDKLAPTLDEIAASRARYFVVRRATPLAAQLQADARFEGLDARLFGEENTAALCPVQVFEILVTRD
ncbi:MAG: hypothetical protein QM813_15730 [Verrucomicrobiota bacterium]